MNVSRDEAAAALGDIDQAGHRIRTHQIYREAGPFLVVWGLIWLVANAITDLRPAWGAGAWLAGIVVGFVLTMFFTVRNAVHRKRSFAISKLEGRVIGRRAALLGVTLMAFFPALFAIVGPLSPRQGNAALSLIWAFLYMAAGAFVGWRLFAIGAVTGAAVLVGYFLIHTHYGLWMGIVGGGALIVGGLWLRKI